MADPADLTSPLAPGTDFAGYRIENMVARGGMGIVYRAVDDTLDRTVALKVIAPEYTGDRAAVSRFKSEAKLAAAIDHPNLVPIYRAGEWEGVLFLAMRFVPGTDLRAFMHEHGPCEFPRIRRIVEQVASALDAAHAHGLVHRDVKPENILLASARDNENNEHVYLTDFGITKRLGASTASVTQTGQWLGTPDYAAPEQIRGLGVDARTDVYSLGCVVHELITGHPPYEKESTVATVWAHIADPPPSPCAHRSDLLPVFDSVIACAMAKEPHQRFPSAGALAEALGKAVDAQLLTEAQKTPQTTIADADVPAALASSMLASEAPTKAARASDLERVTQADTKATVPTPPRPDAEASASTTHAVASTTADRTPTVESGVRDRRRRLIVVAAGILAVATLVGAVLLIALPGKHSAHSGTPAAGSASTAQRATPAAGGASLKQDVKRLDAIVRLYIVGHHLSQDEKQYAAAAQNRMLVLQRLAAFHAPPELRAAASTLRQITAYSLLYNQLKARREKGFEQPDKAHNALLPRFVREFGPYAQSYLGYTYNVGDF